MKPLRTRLVNLNARLTKQTEFIGYYRPQQDDDERDSFGNRVAKVGGVLAGGAALYGGASYLRGRLGQKPGDWNLAQNKPGLAGIVANVKAGHSANVADASAAFGKLKSAYNTASTAFAPAAAKVGSAMGAGASLVGQAAKSATSDLLKSKLFRGGFRK